LARASALSYKAKENGIVVVDALTMAQPKTQSFIQVLKNMNVADKKTLILMGEKDNNLYLSSRNVQGTQVQMANMVNTYDIMNCHQVIFIGSAHEVLTEILKK
jgi:large subunit ribosomal protein L4